MMRVFLHFVRTFLCVKMAVVSRLSGMYFVKQFVIINSFAVVQWISSYLVLMVM